MDKKIKLLLGILVFVVLLVGAFFAYELLLSGVGDNLPENLVQGRQEEGSLQQRAPDFTILDMDDNEVRLSDFIGTPVILNFWASWCPTCVREKPYFDELYETMGDEVRILKINLLDGQQETRNTVEAFMAGRDHVFPIYFDTTGEATRAYGVIFLPMTFFINAEGYVAARAQGSVNEETLRRGIELIMPQ